MVKTFMLLLAFTITDPDGFERDEKVHILSRHFDTQNECVNFVNDWSGVIKDRGLGTVQGMLAEGWKVDIAEIGCAVNPTQAIEKVTIAKFIDGENVTNDVDETDTPE
tara:strand:+ start:205 stop:528 length:324 start_codon:yes stop_codon:yes gene_type:complete